MPNLPIRAVLRDALHYWEPRRIVYNLILFAVVACWFVLSWPHFRGAMTLPNLLALCVLALFANLCYSAAYLADVLLQYSSSRAIARGGRWVIWSAGTLFAVLLANYWIADEIYPYVR